VRETKEKKAILTRRGGFKGAERANNISGGEEYAGFPPAKRKSEEKRKAAIQR